MEKILVAIVKIAYSVRRKVKEKQNLAFAAHFRFVHPLE